MISPNPLYGDLLTIEEFLDGVECTAFTDYDGYGHPSDGTFCDTNVVIRPSEAPECIPEGTTHVLWFNK